jgi:hypothetical protein
VRARRRLPLRRGAKGQIRIGIYLVWPFFYTELSPLLLLRTAAEQVRSITQLLGGAIGALVLTLPLAGITYLRVCRHLGTTPAARTPGSTAPSPGR